MAFIFYSNKSLYRYFVFLQLKAKKSKKYNLEDDDEGGDFAIPLNDDFDEHVASDEDDDSPGNISMI